MPIVTSDEHLHILTTLKGALNGSARKDFPAEVYDCTSDDSPFVAIDWVHAATRQRLLLWLLDTCNEVTWIKKAAHTGYPMITCALLQDEFTIDMASLCLDYGPTTGEEDQAIVLTQAVLRAIDAMKTKGEEEAPPSKLQEIMQLLTDYEGERLKYATLVTDTSVNVYNYEQRNITTILRDNKE
jgi:hypothetical protein